MYRREANISINFRNGHIMFIFNKLSLHLITCFVRSVTAVNPIINRL